MTLASKKSNVDACRLRSKLDY